MVLLKTKSDVLMLVYFLFFELFGQNKISKIVQFLFPQDLQLVGPYGNRFRLHLASPQQRLALSGGENGGGRPGSEGSRCVGMDTLTLEAGEGTERPWPWPGDVQVPVGTAEKAAQFYKEAQWSASAGVYDVFS